MLKTTTKLVAEWGIIVTSLYLCEYVKSKERKMCMFLGNVDVKMLKFI